MLSSSDEIRFTSDASPYIDGLQGTLEMVIEANET
jgi:hypothetical protein